MPTNRDTSPNRARDILPYDGSRVGVSTQDEATRLFEAKEMLTSNDIYITKLEMRIRELESALKWIMPKVHQGNHDGEIEQCQKATIQEE